MNNKEYSFLRLKLSELVNNNIISTEQYIEADKHFQTNKKDKASLVTIFTAIGILLIALSIITIFAFNWDTIPKGIKVLISFIPLIITSIMMYKCIATKEYKISLYTSIFAPLSIIATNSLITQIFHIQMEIFEIFFISMLMFLPIMLTLRNSISLFIYGFCTIIYAMNINSYLGESITLFRTILLALPLFIYNFINYIENKDCSKNVLMWFFNIIILTLILFLKEVLRIDAIIIYVYLLHLITIKLFEKENVISSLLRLIFIVYLLISCISSDVLGYVEYMQFDVDTLILSLIAGVFIYLSKVYKDIKEIFIFIFVFLVQYTKMDATLLFILINILTIAYGVYKIIDGNYKNVYGQAMQGIAIILILIMIRFMNSDLGFLTKSVMFLITGSSFIISANVIKRRLGGNTNG
ncbi:MAG: DUF2157 domain-containing protein [Clostridia bacterium]|nr:DUF2157 domain-containing protein [Clostridia bacterium]